MKRLEDIDLNLLLLLHWLLKEKSVTRAGQHLGITQSAASRSLARLRTLFQDELLIRTGKTYTASKLAASLQPKLDAAILEMRTALVQAETFDPGQADITLVVACNDYLATVGMALWEANVRPLAPHLRLSWRPLGPGTLDGLASGDVDMVFAPYAATRAMPKTAGMQDIVIRPWMSDRFILFSAKPAAAPLELEAFAQARHVMVSPQGKGRGEVDERLAEHGLERRISDRTWSFGLAAQTALRTEALAVLPERLAEIYGREHIAELPVELSPLDSFVAWHASRTNDPAHRWVRQKWGPDQTDNAR